MTENNTREKIISAMYSLSAEKGYDRSSIGLICELVGITKPSVYFYFKNKEEIFLETIKTVFHDDISWIPDYKDIKDLKEYKKVFRKIGKGVISGFHSDTERQKFMSELSIQATRIAAVRDFLNVHRSKRLEEMKDFVEHGLKINAFRTKNEAAKIAKLLDITLLAIGDHMMNEPPSNGIAVWNALADALLKEE